MFLDIGAIEPPRTASQAVKMISFVVCLHGPAGRVTVHPIEDSGREESEATFQVPSPAAPGNVTCMALSAHFLIAGTAAGMLLYYQCQDKALLNEFKHTGGAIVKVFPQPYGTR